MTGIRRGVARSSVRVSLPLLAIGLAPLSQADDGCGPGMYCNVDTNQCPAGPGPVGPGR